MNISRHRFNTNATYFALLLISRQAHTDGKYQPAPAGYIDHFIASGW
jgi:hypothetical protein